MTMKRLFGEDCEVKGSILNPQGNDPNKEPISKHIGAGHTIITNSAAGETFKMCKPCCMEVYEDDDCGALMF